MFPPKVFISYSHDTQEHKDWVLKLASDLRNNEIDASIDQWDLVPGQDLASFMHDGIASADRVLLICTESYVKKSDEGAGGVGYERLIVTAEVVAAIETKKFIPIVRNNTSSQKTPSCIGARLYIDFAEDFTYAQSLEQLCREILGVPARQKPPLGKNPFSADPPSATESARVVGLTGVLHSGESVLASEWFEKEKLPAEEGIAKLGLLGAMELRFALHEPISRSQVDLLTAVRAAEIRTFGWPIGIILSNREEYKPRPFANGVRAIVNIERDNVSGEKSYDYWALSTTGDFFLLQSLFEDMREPGGSRIYFNTRIVRVTEALMFAEGLYKQLGVPVETRLSVRVTHRGLEGRQLASAGGRRGTWADKCMEQSCETETVVTVGRIRENLVADVKRLTAPLFMLFDFAEFQDSIYEDIVRKFEAGQAT